MPLLRTIHPSHTQPSFIMSADSIHPASMAVTTSATTGGHCPGVAAQIKREASLPDLFLVPGVPSKGYMDPATKGKGAGVVLDGERASATFSVEKMTLLLYSGKERLARRRELTAIIENNPVFRKWDKPFHGRVGRMTRAAQKLEALVALLKRLKIDDPIERYLMFMAADDILPHELHRSMFIPTLQSQCSPEQLAAWLPPALEYKMLGTYVQTELGHGSFVRGLETTATYDPSTEEFVLHSPTLTSTKWWPGNLGKFSTHCVLMARLISNGKDHGVQPFYLPLRDTSTYEVLPGRILGDIGPKMGYESNDNGFLRLDQVRIPRFNHFARYITVEKDGTVGPSKGAPKHAKMAYLTMVFTRSMIVAGSASQLAKALTIAIRYSAVRRQFPDYLNPGHGEAPVLNYQTQQLSLFTLLATTYAFHVTGLFMRKLYFDSMEKVKQGDTSILAELHSTSSGLKALTTTMACEGIEVARQACGGHGYSRFSGIVDLLLDYVPSQTYEGDNQVMYLQAARTLLKTYGSLRSGKVQLPEGSQNGYMLNIPAELKKKSTLKSAGDLAAGCVEGHQAQLAAFRHRAARLMFEAGASMQASVAAHPKWTFEQHWEGLKVAMVRLARAHCQYVIVDNFHQSLQKGGICSGEPELQPILRTLSDLFAWTQIERDMGDFTEDGYFSYEQTGWIRARILTLLHDIRPNAIALVDSFDYSDHYLNSALGRYDGDVYTCLYEWAQRNPMNTPENSVGPGIKEYVIPILSGQSKL